MGEAFHDFLGLDGMASEPVPAVASEIERSAVLTLALEDMIPDARGEIVIRNEASSRIALVSDQAVVGNGIESSHVTGAGIDVGGFAYCSFVGGVTVYYPADHHFMVIPP
jgi:hypothetical protein